MTTKLWTPKETDMERYARLRAKHDAKVAAMKRAKGDEIRANMRRWITERRRKARLAEFYRRRDRAVNMTHRHSEARAAKVGAEAERLIALWNNQPKE